MTSFLYRGPLSSCNYGCEYCPFAKTKNTRTELADDATKLQRFVSWVCKQDSPSSVFFTPWGEALIRPAYQKALQELSRHDSLEVAAIQTNLSGPIHWTEDCEPAKIGIWATYHGDWCNTQEFVAKVHKLHELGVRVSVGVVGFPYFSDKIEALRTQISSEIYLWINAAKSSVTYLEHQIQRFENVDPHFRTNTLRHSSIGHSCHAGSQVVAVDGDGNVRRCHFIDTVIANLYEESFSLPTVPSVCTNQCCGCHIGYVHLQHLQLAQVYGPGILERIPATYSR